MSLQIFLPCWLISSNRCFVFSRIRCLAFSFTGGGFGALSLECPSPLRSALSWVAIDSTAPWPALPSPFPSDQPIDLRSLKPLFSSDIGVGAAGRFFDTARNSTVSAEHPGTGFAIHPSKTPVGSFGREGISISLPTVLRRTFARSE